MKPKVIVIVGPTASGKTALSIELAKRIDGEIVSCDSMQIYEDMNIGSAKPTIEEMQGIKHYLIDIVKPTERFSVAEYKKRAEQAIEEILKKGKTPIVIGGTGLYANSLIYGIEYNEIYEYINKQINNKNIPILIYCFSGQSASIAVACVFLMKYKKWSIEFSIGYMMKISPIINIPSWLFTQLQRFQENEKIKEKMNKK